MDEIVKQAMQKWPNIPHCYGWLALDNRGAWRMRDEHAQHHHLPGDKIAHTALLEFIHRNYTHDDQGRWYFQNGPQRVFVNLAIAPYIAITDPAAGLRLHTQEAITTLQCAWMTDSGILFIQANNKIAAIQDTDMAACLPYLHLDGTSMTDDQLSVWLEDMSSDAAVFLHFPQHTPVAVQRLYDADCEQHFGFVKTPAPD